MVQNLLDFGCGTGDFFGASKIDFFVTQMKSTMFSFIKNNSRVV
jgi:hypothetical protein